MLALARTLTSRRFAIPIVASRSMVWHRCVLAFRQPSSYNNRLAVRPLSDTNSKLQNLKPSIDIDIRLRAAQKDWNELLDIYQSEHNHFSHWSWATIVNKLKAQRPGDIERLKADSRFQDLLGSLESCLCSSFAQFNPQTVAIILHGLAVLRVKNPTILDKVVVEQAHWLIEKGDPQNIANTAWSCAKLGFKAPGLFGLIDKHALKLIQYGDPQNIANTAWSCAKLGFKAPGLFGLIDKHALKLIQYGNSQNIANTAWSCATLGIKAPYLFQLINKNALKLIQHGNSQTLSNMAWACSTLGFAAPNLFQLIDKYALNLIQHGNPQAIANTAWSCATLRFAAPNLFQLINTHALNLIQHGNSQTLSNMAWACSTLGFAAPNLFQLIDKNALKLIQHGDPQAIANTAWSCATLRFAAPNLFQLIDKNALNLIQHGNPQAIANIAWSCATLRFAAPNLFQLIDKYALNLIQHGNSQEIANIAWSCAKLGFAAPHLFQQIDMNALKLIQHGDSQNLSNMAWACATLGFAAPNLFQLIDKYALNLIQHGNSQEIANIAWSCAKLGFAAPHLFQQIDMNALKLIQHGDSQNLSNMAWACATLGFKAPNLFQLIDNNSIDVFLGSATVQSACLLLYALVILDLPGDHSEALVKKLWKHASAIDPSMFSHENLQQLLYLSHYASANGITLPPLPDTLQRLVTQSGYLGDANHSDNEDEYSSLLDKIGFVHEREVSPFGNATGNFLAIDFADSQQKIAVEYDGGSHFLINLESNGTTAGRENGTTKSKRRLLQKLGWKVVNIPYYDNLALNMKHQYGEARTEAKKQYLKDKLANIGAALKVVSSEN